jgi:catechol 2,3-dioxygenase-like lactoylglutathione lyase family enzyme
MTAANPARGVEMVTERSETAARTSLDHVSAISLFVEDLNAAKSFYRDVFGVDVVFEDENSVCVEFDHLLLNLFLVSARSSKSSQPPSRAALPVRGSSSASGRGRRRGVRGSATARRRAAHRSDGPGVGKADGDLRRSRRPQLGSRTGALTRRRVDIAAAAVPYSRAIDGWGAA